MSNTNVDIEQIQANVLSEETNENEQVFTEQNPDTEIPNPVVVDHIMFTEQDVATIISLIDDISVKGATNVTGLSNIYTIITTRGMRVPVTIQPN